MTQNHCIVWPERVALKQNLNLEKLDDLGSYFQEILSDKTLVTKDFLKVAN